MKHLLRNMCWFVLILVLAAGCGGSGGKGSSSGPDSTIDDFIARYVKLTKEKDSAGLAQMYTDPAEWTVSTGTRNLSRAEIEALFDAAYAITTIIYDSQAKDITITVSGDTAIAEFKWVQDVYNSVLDQRVKTEGDMTWSLKRIGGKWFIATQKS